MHKLLFGITLLFILIASGVQAQFKIVGTSLKENDLDQASVSINLLTQVTNQFIPNQIV